MPARPLALILLLLAAPARAEEAKEAKRPLARPAEVGVTMALGLLWRTAHLAQPFLSRPSCPCDAASVNALDRPAINLQLPHGNALSNSAFLLDISQVLLVDLATTRGPHDALLEFTLAVQSGFIAELITEGLKAAVSRPYPYMYRADIRPHDVHDGFNYASFPSGHTAGPMAGAITAAYLAERRGAPLPWRVLAWTAGPALALAAGSLQIAVANHFPTDVAAGAALGVAVGLANPLLHQLWEPL